MAVVHLAHPGYRAACGQNPPIQSTLVTSEVTCQRCPTTLKFSSRREFEEVVDALRYPKEEHPCLSPSTASTT